MYRTPLLLTVALAAAGHAQAQPLTLAPLGTANPGAFRDADPRVAEINAYDPGGRRVYVVNPFDGRLDVIDIADPSAPAFAAPVPLLPACAAALGAACPLALGLEPNSVAVHGRLMAVAVANAVRTANGHAVFFELQGADTPRFLAAVEVGALPDMVTFSADGRHALIANEGEPDQTYTIDPPGSVSIIDTTVLDATTTARRVGFEAFDTPAQRQRLAARGVRIFGPGALPSQDLEPEYITVSGDTAYVSLQENNALAIIDIPSATVQRLVGLGVKDHARAGNALDPSDRDNASQPAAWPVVGLYQPDAIQAFTVRGSTYVITANEGDAREYAGYVEAVRLGSNSYVLDPVRFPDAAALKANAALGRLNVSTASGDIDGDGDFDVIHTFGGRSVSIRDDRGRLLWDSGSFFEGLARRLDWTGPRSSTRPTAATRATIAATTRASSPSRWWSGWSMAPRTPSSGSSATAG